MPGIVVFRRRWSVGSDDFVVPALFLVVLHIAWIIVLGVILAVVEFDRNTVCTANLYDHVLGYLVILSVCVVLETTIMIVSMRGTILDTAPRASMQYLLYARLVILLVELSWLIVGVVWVAQHYKSCAASPAKKAILGIIVCNWAVMLSVLISVWCTFDAAGRSWVKMKRYQESVRDKVIKPEHKKCSGSRRRNWRNRKAFREYEQSWDRRFSILFCCVRKGRNRHSLTEVAKLFTEFFRDLDVVPSDIVAGLVLLRKHQKLHRTFVVSQGTNDVYQFLSGVPITPRTQFVSLKNPELQTFYKDVVYYMRYALGAYGWVMYMKGNTATGLCHIIPNLKCCRCCAKSEDVTVIDDNCCQCNLAALRQVIGTKEIDLIYVTFHVDIGETPFFIAVDHNKRKIVISIRGTLSLQDVLTDLKADAEQLPLIPPKEDWLGHKGMVQAAIYIKKKIQNEMLLAKAFGRDLDRCTQEYDLVCVGHSLGAGTAAILAILLHEEYPNVLCYAYSPPGGLISEPCVEGTKSFITSVVVGKDVVPRIGLYQLETMRQDLINAIKQSKDPKWKLIMAGIFGCCDNDKNKLSGNTYETYQNLRREKENRCFTHPRDSEIALTSHTPLFLPGKIIHVVRNHPKEKRWCRRSEPVYQAIWAENKDFDEVLISPTMVNDHMPDHVLAALEKVLTNVSPAKPVRRLLESERRSLLTNSIDPGSLDRSSDQSFCPQCQDISNQQNNPIDLTYNPEDIIIPGVTFNLGTEANSLCWDYSTLPINHVRRHPLPESVSRAERTKSFPPPLQKLRPGLQLDELGNPEWSSTGLNVFAPLASPETLSDASSLDTMSSKQCSDGFQRTSRLDPIPASPIRPASRGEYCYTTPTSSPLHHADSPTDLSQLNGDASYDNIGADISPVTPDVMPLAQSTPLKPEVMQDEAPCGLSTLTDLSDAPLYSDVDETRTDVSHPPDDLGVKPLSVVSSSDPDQTNLTDIENRIDNKMTEIQNNDPYKLTYGGDTGMTDSSSQEDFALHSPDSTCNQYLYDDYGGHYSPAGRGYPHGAYMADVSSTDELLSDQHDEPVSDVGDFVPEVPSPHDDNNTQQEPCDSSPDIQPVVLSSPSQDLLAQVANLSDSGNNVCASTDASPLSSQCAVSPETATSFETASEGSGNLLGLTDPMAPVCTSSAIGTHSASAASPKSISRSSSDASLADSDCIHQPLLNKQGSCASTSSRSSRRTMTNGSDMDDRSSVNSYEQNILLLDEEMGSNPRLNGVKVTLAEQHSFGETYYV